MTSFATTSRKPRPHLLVWACLCMLVLPACLSAGGRGCGEHCVPLARTATLTWEAPETYADGTPLRDLAGYKIYRAIRPRDYDPAQTVVVPLDDPRLSCSRKKAGPNRRARTICTYSLRDLGPEPLYFAVSAYSRSGKESARSNELKK